MALAIAILCRWPPLKKQNRILNLLLHKQFDDDDNVGFTLSNVGRFYLSQVIMTKDLTLSTRNPDFHSLVFYFVQRKTILLVKGEPLRDQGSKHQNYV